MTPIPLGILDFPTGAAGAYDLLETQILTSSAASVTFTGLGSYTDYKHLQIRMLTHSTYNGGNTGYLMTFNSDSGANYSRHGLQANWFPAATGVTSYAQTGQTSIFGSCYGADYSNKFWPAVWDILDFSNANKNTTVKGFEGMFGSNDFGHSPEGGIRLRSGAWYNTSAVTSISFVTATGDNFVSGSRFSLMGVK